MDNAGLSNNRMYSFDVMRIIATCIVVLGHISADYVKSYPSDSLEFISNNLLNSFSRFAVPIFFMISGALMLNEDKKISNKKIIHAALHIFILLLTWSILYSVAYHIVKPLIFKEAISISAIVHTIFYGHYHMWFLFVLIGLYLITPILRLFIRRENLPLITAYLNFSVVVCFGLSFVNQIVNTFTSHENFLSDYISYFQMGYFYDAIVYYIMGWYILNNNIKRRSYIAIYICGVLGYLATVVCTQMFYDNTQSPNNFFYANKSLNVFLYGIAVFIFLYNLLKRKNITSCEVVLKLSSFTFGVYLIHPVFLFGLKIIIHDIGPAPVDTVLIFICATLLSFFSIFVISKIPIIKKLIRG